MGYLYCKCNTCNSIFDGSLLETPCPICNDHLNYAESNRIKNYFDIPKLNDPDDFIHYDSFISVQDKLPFSQSYNRNYLIRNNNRSYHVLSVVPIFKNVNNMNILTNLCITWDNDYINNTFGIVPDVKDCLKFKLTEISYKNILQDFDKDNNSVLKDYRIKVCNKIVPDETYERFLRNLEEFSSSYDISDLFSLYNSINWNLLDDIKVKKTYYEYAAINYLLHIFELIHVPNIDIIDYDTRLLNFQSIEMDLNFERYGEDRIDIYLTSKEFLDKYINNDESPLLENFDFNNYEDVYDYFSIIKEGAIAPNAVGLNIAAQRSSSVFNKLYELGYNPKMNVYSLGETTSLIPTFQIEDSIYYIECNDNIMKGINEFDSIEDMYSVLNEVYNEDNYDNLFITIEGLTDSVLKFILNNSKDNKEFLTRLIDLNNKQKENFIYTNTVQDEQDFKDSIISEFDIKEMTPQNLFKYGKTHYKLRNCQKLPGNQHGFMFIDSNENIAGYIIIEDKIYNLQTALNRTIKTVVALEASSDYKLQGIEMAMINYVKRKLNITDLRIECRNFLLADKIEATDEYRKIDNPDLPFTLFESINESNKDQLVLNEAINANKRKQIEEKVYKVFDILDKTGANTQKYKNLFKSMSDEKFDKYIKDLILDDKKNFYLEVLPNKNCPRIKDCKEALDYLKVPTEEYLYYRHDGHEENPIRTRYKVPILYINLRRLQQMLSKKNTYSLDINKRNMKTG